MYKVIVDLSIRLNLLCNFTKQASIVMASNFHRLFSTFHLYRLFATLIC